MVTAALDFESLGKRWRICLDGQWIAIREYQADGELTSYTVARRRVLEQGKAKAVVATLSGLAEIAADRSVVKDGLESLDLHMMGRGAGASNPSAGLLHAETASRWVGTTAAARMAGCDRKTLLRMFARGQIPDSACRHEGRRILWDSLVASSLSGNAWAFHQRKVENHAANVANGGAATRWVSTTSAASMAGCNKDTLLKRFGRGQIPRSARRVEGRVVLWDSLAIGAIA